MNKDICGNCKLYDDKKSINNCRGNIVGTVHPNQIGCYKIQFTKIKK